MNWVITGLRLVPLVIEAIHAAENLLSKKGREKEDHAVKLASRGLRLAEEVTGRDLVNDPAVEPAIREFIRAYVALQNAVRHARQLPPASGDTTGDTSDGQ